LFEVNYSAPASSFPGNSDKVKSRFRPSSLVIPTDLSQSPAQESSTFWTSLQLFSLDVSKYLELLFNFRFALSQASSQLFGSSSTGAPRTLPVSRCFSVTKTSSDRLRLIVRLVLSRRGSDPGRPLGVGDPGEPATPAGDGGRGGGNVLLVPSPPATHEPRVGEQHEEAQAESRRRAGLHRRLRHHDGRRRVGQQLDARQPPEPQHRAAAHRAGHAGTDPSTSDLFCSMPPRLQF